jgi:hypothetical protein
MASPPRSPEREEERRSNVLTLVIASVASASAALIVSQLWIAGTWIAAAVTPVLVTLLNELLHRPTERITKGLTSDRAAVERPTGEPPVRMYRAGSSGPTRTRRRKIAYGAVLGTAGLAFAIAVVALTVPELVAGQSVGKNNGRTTFFGGSNKHAKTQQSPTNTSTDKQRTETQPTTPTEQTTPTQQTETTPSQTTPTTPPPQTAPTQTTPPG